MASHHNTVTTAAVSTAIRIAVHHIAAWVNAGNRFTEEDIRLGDEEAFAAAGGTSSAVATIVHETGEDVAATCGAEVRHRFDAGPFE
ncbi:hypothetical protein B1H26_27790 [Amycolatopsis sp. BJA-103]|nr:hypothetical protein BKN51_41905 [Amycolatopsis sp. BJA-103]PNE16096.1 hypothetical protein B1H26_27790 [Amycolatopsis sp. BJA-103]